MSEGLTWFCFKGVLPKKDYELIDESNEHISFYKAGEPIVVLEKRHRFHPLTVNVILNRLSVSLEEFRTLLKICNIQNITSK